MAGFVEIETPDGIVEFPDTMSDDEIIAVLQRLYPPQSNTNSQVKQQDTVQQQSAPQEAPQQSNSFLARITRDAGKRYGQALGAVQRKPTVPVLEPAFQIAGQAGLGLAGDVVGNVVQSAATGLNALSGGRLGRGAKAALSTVGKLPSFGGGTIGERIPGEVAQLSKSYGGFAKDHPNIAANLEAGTNFVTTLLPALKGTGAVSKGAKEVGEKVSRIGSPKIITADDLADESRVVYKEAEDAGGLLEASVTDDFLDDVLKRIEPKSEEAKTAFRSSKTTEIDDTIMSMIDLSGKPLSLRGVEEIDQLLTQKKMQNFNPATGGYNEIGDKYREIQDALRQTVDDAIAAKRVTGGDKGFKALKKASALWSKRIKLKNIEDIIQRAEMTEQPSTSLRSGLRTLLNNPKKIKSYTKTEREAIKKAAEKGVATELLNMFGSRLPSIIATGSGNVMTGGALRLGSIATREGANALQLKRVADLGQVIAYGGKPPKPSALSLVAKPTGAALRGTGAALGTLDNATAQRLMAIEAMDQFREQQNGQR